LDKRCVTCHSCYNSPCQAKFSSFDGIDRGGSKEKVYLAERLFSQQPTRLFMDAKTTEEWRKKKFFSLRENISTEGLKKYSFGEYTFVLGINNSGELFLFHSVKLNVGKKIIDGKDTLALDSLKGPRQFK